MVPASDTIASWVDGTIAAWSEFTPTSGTIRSARVMGNFGVFRGHMLPFDPTTTAFVADTYDLGSSTYRWRNVYAKALKLTPIHTSGSMSITAGMGVVLMDSTAGTSTGSLPSTVGITGTMLTVKNIGTGGKEVRLAGTTAASSLVDGTTTTDLVDLESATLIARDGWWRI